jgi:hypothetical protein
MNICIQCQHVAPINSGLICVNCYNKNLQAEGFTIQEESKEPPKAEALRFNEGKTPYAYVPMDLLDGAAKVMAYGANKYKDSENFRKGYSDLLSPLSSVIRHLVEVQRSIHTNDLDNTKGHLLDKESGEAHIHHLITSVMMLIHSMRLKGFKL